MDRITEESMQVARQWFADNALACIAEVKSGAVRVNDPDVYFAQCMRRHDDALAGKSDHTFALRQRAWLIQTGECRALLP